MTLHFGFKAATLWQVCGKHFLTERDEPKTLVRQVNPQTQSSCELRIQHLGDSRSDYRALSRGQVEVEAGAQRTSSAICANSLGT